MAYCAECGSEYEPHVQRCPDCDVVLVSQRPERPRETFEMFDVYLCYDEQEAERAQGVLEDEGIQTLLRDHASTAFPMNVGATSEKLIAVAPDAATRAGELLQAAISDGVLVGEGRVLLS